MSNTNADDGKRTAARIYPQLDGHRVDPMRPHPRDCPTNSFRADRAITVVRAIERPIERTTCPHSLLRAPLGPSAVAAIPTCTRRYRRSARKPQEPCHHHPHHQRHRHRRLGSSSLPGTAILANKCRDAPRQEAPELALLVRSAVGHATTRESDTAWRC